MVNPITFDKLPARITVPAHHTVEYKDKDGNLVAKYDTPRTYSKDCKIQNLNPHKAPWTAVFTEHAPPEVVAAEEDNDWIEGE